jgi:hypothetical protein
MNMDIMNRMMVLNPFDVIRRKPALGFVGLDPLPPPAVVHFQHRDDLQCVQRHGRITDVSRSCGGTMKA